MIVFTIVITVLVVFAIIPILGHLRLWQYRRRGR